MDVFDGTCGASRPFSATDNNAYINNIVSAITGASANASGSIEGITNSVGAVGNAAASGSALAVGGAALGALACATTVKTKILPLLSLFLWMIRSLRTS